MGVYLYKRPSTGDYKRPDAVSLYFRPDAFYVRPSTGLFNRPDGSSLFERINMASIALQVTSAVDGRIGGLTPGPTTINLFSTFDINPPLTFTPNTSVWCVNPPLPAIDTTCVGVWKFGTAYRIGFCLIAPQMIVTAWHTVALGNWPAGCEVIFVNSSGTQVSRVVEGSWVQVGGTDLAIARLNSPVSPDIKPAAFFTDEFAPFLNGRSFAILYVLQVIAVNKSANLAVATLSDLSPGYSLSWVPPTGYPGWAGNVVSGDSGSPIFLVSGSNLVLIGIVSGASPGSFTSDIFNQAALWNIQPPEVASFV